MRASRLRLNRTKTQIMRLGSVQQLQHADNNDILVLSTTVAVVCQTPLYLADDCCLVSDSTRRSLRSADVPTCLVP